MKLENGRLVLRPSMVELAGPEPDVVSYHEVEFVGRGGKASISVNCRELWYLTDLLVVLPTGGRKRA